MTMKRRFFSAPTLTQALLAAARHHAVDPDAVDYQVIEKKHGFIKAPRGVVIEVDPDAPARQDGAVAAPAANTEARPEHPALEPAATVPATKSTEVPFEPDSVEEPADHPALESVDPSVPSEQPPSVIESTAATPELVPPSPASDAAALAAPVFEPEVPAWPEQSTADVASVPGDESSETVVELPAAETTPVLGDLPVTESVVEEATQDEPEPAAAAAPEELSGPVTATEGESAALPVSDSALREAVAEAIDELAFLASLRVQVARVEVGDDGLEVELEGPDSSRLAARGGRALLAMQHLLPRLLFGRLGKAMRCHLDCEGFHAARSERLEGLAQKAAERVRSGGRSWLLEPMAPDERRLVHLALAEEPDIETESVGQGFLKRVRVAQTDQA